MQRPVFPAMKGLEGLRSTRGSAAGRGPTVSNSKAESSMGSFVSLKIAAERLVKEQAAVKIDLDMANSKLKKAMEQIHALEEKVQDANNENAKLNVKQKEDIKAWNGLESKLTATKALCDKLMDTLQLLSTQTNEAEMDKKFFEEKLLENSKIFDAFKSQIDVISEKLEHAEESIRKGKQEMAEVRKEREEIVSSLREQLHAFENLNKGKDDAIMHLKDNIEEKKVQLQGLDSLLKGLQEELKSKEGQCNSLEADVANLVKEKTALQSANDHISRKMSDSSKEIAYLQSIIQDLVLKIEEIDKNSVSAVDNLARLLSTIENHKTQVQQKEDLVAKLSRMKLNQLQTRCADTSSENEALRDEIGVFKGRIHELEKDHEFSMVQHAEECRLAEDKVQVLETKALELKLENNELEALQAKLEDSIKHLTNTLSMTENKMQDLITKISGLEHENADLQERMQTMILEKTEKIETLEGLILEHEAQFSSLGNQINELQSILNDKEQANIQYMEKHKLLEEQLAETQSSLAAAESTLVEARRQYDLMLEGKQTELSKHLREISQKNDQAINDIRWKFDVEKSEIINAEKEKMERFIKEAERKCEEKVEESKEEAKKSLAHIHEEHATLINRIKQEYNEKELNLRAHHKQELERVHLYAENESREKAMSLKKEHEIQLLSLRHELEDECTKLREELQLQRSKEEKQRALLQLQWKVMDEKSQQKNLDLNQQKEHSVSSIKMRDADSMKEKRATRIEKQKKDIDISGIMRTPLANMLRRVEKENAGSAISIPKHSRKVTHHEYEVETTNGKTITKRRKTKSTVSFGDHAECTKVKSKTPLASSKGIVVTQPHPSHIGDLFTEGSLNPYTDDPYAFD